MASLSAARALPGKGLEGDRYFKGVGTFSPHPPKPDFEITLVEKEKIEAFASEASLPFTASHARRNLVTEGVDLNALVGKEFRVGEVRLRGMRLCEPCGYLARTTFPETVRGQRQTLARWACGYLAKTTFPETVRGLVHKGGLRAQIVTEGTIRVGDAVIVVPRERSDHVRWWPGPWREISAPGGSYAPMACSASRGPGSTAPAAATPAMPIPHAAARPDRPRRTHARAVPPTGLPSCDQPGVRIDQQAEPERPHLMNRAQSWRVCRSVTSAWRRPASGSISAKIVATPLRTSSWSRKRSKNLADARE